MQWGLGGRTSNLAAGWHSDADELNKEVNLSKSSKAALDKFVGRDSVANEHITTFKDINYWRGIMRKNRDLRQQKNHLTKPN